jgi:hypothetical protein
MLRHPEWFYVISTSLREDAKDDPEEIGELIDSKQLVIAREGFLHEYRRPDANQTPHEPQRERQAETFGNDHDV